MRVSVRPLFGFCFGSFEFCIFAFIVCVINITGKLCIFQCDFILMSESAVLNANLCDVLQKSKQGFTDETVLFQS